MTPNLTRRRILAGPVGVAILPLLDACPAAKRGKRKAKGGRR